MDPFDPNLGKNTLLSFLVLQCNAAVGTLTRVVAGADALRLVKVLCIPRSAEVYPSMKNINRRILSL
jgi:hypothetical protein